MNGILVCVSILIIRNKCVCVRNLFFSLFRKNCLVITGYLGKRPLNLVFLWSNEKCTTKEALKYILKLSKNNYGFEKFPGHRTPHTYPTMYTHQRMKTGWKPNLFACTMQPKSCRLLTLDPL